MARPTIRPSIRVITRDRGYLDLLKRVEESKNAGLVVGILDELGGTNVHDGTGLTVAEIAEVHEFGLGNNPERSFIRAWFDQHREPCRRVIAAAMKAVVAGKITKVQAIEQVGALFVAQIQQRIRSHIPPPLQQATIDRKGSDVPLIDKGQLWSSIGFKPTDGSER